jgi:hypothetical protein
MPQTHQSIVVDAPSDTVWEKVRDFHDMSWAPNVVTRCVAEGTPRARRWEPGAYSTTYSTRP